MPTTQNIFCLCCNKEIKASLKTGDKIYPHRKDLYNLYFWQCPKCGNFVGTHKNSPKHAPLGNIPSIELKKARISAHYYIDRLWKSKLYTRADVYKLISKEMGYSYHTGTTRTIEECNKAKDIAIKLYERSKTNVSSNI